MSTGQTQFLRSRQVVKNTSSLGFQYTFLDLLSHQPFPVFTAANRISDASATMSRWVYHSILKSKHRDWGSCICSIFSHEVKKFEAWVRKMQFPSHLCGHKTSAVESSRERNSPANGELYALIVDSQRSMLWSASSSPSSVADDVPPAAGADTQVESARSCTRCRYISWCNRDLKHQYTLYENGLSESMLPNAVLMSLMNRTITRKFLQKILSSTIAVMYFNFSRDTCVWAYLWRSRRHRTARYN